MPLTYKILQAVTHGHVADEGLEHEQVERLRGLERVGQVLTDGARVHPLIATARLPHKLRQRLHAHKRGKRVSAIHT